MITKHNLPHYFSFHLKLLISIHFYCSKYCTSRLALYYNNKVKKKTTLTFKAISWLEFKLRNIVRTYSFLEKQKYMQSLTIKN